MRAPSERLKQSLETDNLWLHVLKMFKAPCYAYEMENKLSRLNANRMTIYSVIYRLELGGYVKRVFKRRAAGPDRKYYAITAKGRAELRSGVALLKKITRALS
ncbi:MAG: helix-turn-helix transcriptional regulator [Candidatus Aenigmatarchaeota archaeon]